MYLLADASCVYSNTRRILLCNQRTTHRPSRSTTCHQSEGMSSMNLPPKGMSLMLYRWFVGLGLGWEIRLLSEETAHSKAVFRLFFFWSPSQPVLRHQLSIARWLPIILLTGNVYPASTIEWTGKGVWRRRLTVSIFIPALFQPVFTAVATPSYHPQLCRKRTYLKLSCTCTCICTCRWCIKIRCDVRYGILERARAATILTTT